MNFYHGIRASRPTYMQCAYELDLVQLEESYDFEEWKDHVDTFEL